MILPMNNFTTDIVVFAAHPDDAEIWCGGLLAKAASFGQKTGVIDLTQGELSTGGDLETRKEETKKASIVLGLTFRENLGFPDGQISYGEPQGTGISQLRAAVEILRIKRPEIVLIPFSQERHPDHVACSDLITRAVFFSGVKKFEGLTKAEKFTPRQIIYYQMRYEFRPSFVVDISAVHETKMRAIRCYQSQLYRKDLKPAEQTLLNSQLAGEAIEVRDRYYGAMIGASHGEAYLIKNVLPMSDPLLHFQKNALSQPLIYPVQ